MELGSDVLSAWELGSGAAPLGEGHINDTWLVPGRTGNRVLQRLNLRVFADPSLVMSNVERVVRHLNNRAPGWVPQVLQTVHGRSAYVDGEGQWWRCWTHVVDGRVLPELQTPEQAHTAGWVFGRTQALLKDLPGPRLKDTIGDFLRLQHYLAEYDCVADASVPQSVQAEHDVVMARRSRFDQSLIEPNAYIHGDCKLNNLLFSSAGQVAAVVDLDTVMWGHWAWDLGDLIRSAVIRKGALWVDGFAALVSGFREGSEEDRAGEVCVLAPQHVCYMLGVRYLTDYLNGNQYFKVSASDENLVRARRQFTALKLLQEQEHTLLRRI
ncbi:MAG: aminoglycoside phosphotransferase family protein [Proteobacteria bacterium]|nr:aminoglycoside phosphotransferase family protein [Pseudomonadota bacterium]